MGKGSGKSGYAVRLYREDLNFSASHISTYGDLMEGQHGHNYQLSIEIRGPLDEDGLVIDFRVVKQILKSIKDTLNHRTLVPGRHSRLSIECSEKSTRIRFADEKLELPTRDVVLLGVANVTSELLAFHVFESIRDRLPAADLERLDTLSVEVIESPGQSASYSGALGS